MHQQRNRWGEKLKGKDGPIYIVLQQRYALARPQPLGSIYALRRRGVCGIDEPLHRATHITFSSVHLEAKDHP